jgi:hypothetical protein
VLFGLHVVFMRAGTYACTSTQISLFLSLSLSLSLSLLNTHNKQLFVDVFHIAVH